MLRSLLFAWAAGCGYHSAALSQHAGSHPWPVITALQPGSRHCPHSPAGWGLFREAEECQSPWLTCKKHKGQTRRCEHRGRFPARWKPFDQGFNKWNECVESCCTDLPSSLRCLSESPSCFVALQRRTSPRENEETAKKPRFQISTSWFTV